MNDSAGQDRLVDSLSLSNEFFADYVSHGGSADLLRVLLKDGALMATVIAIANSNQPTRDYTFASLILGDDFISPEQVAHAYGFRYTDEQLAQFVNTLPDRSVIYWLRANGFILYPGPVSDMNLFHLSRLDPSAFCTKNNDVWFEHPKCSFFRQDIVRGGKWQMHRRGVLPKTVGKVWEEQLKCVTAPERVPNVPEVAYGVMTYRRVRSGKLLGGQSVRTFSVAASGEHVYVEDKEAGGLFLYDFWDEGRHARLGVSTVRD